MLTTIFAAIGAILGGWILVSGLVYYKQGGPRYRIVDKSDRLQGTFIVQREVLLGWKATCAKFSSGYEPKRVLLAEARQYLHQIAVVNRSPSLVYDSKLDGLDTILTGEKES